MRSGAPGVMRTGELEGVRSIAHARLSAGFVVHMCTGEQWLMFGSHRIFYATPWAFRRLSA